jgi:putative tricarboxylic transport membrane protein
MIEDNLQRTMTLYDGSFSFLWQRPVSLAITVLLIAVVLVPIGRTLRGSGPGRSRDSQAK